MNTKQRARQGLFRAEWIGYKAVPFDRSVDPNTYAQRCRAEESGKGYVREERVNKSGRGLDALVWFVYFGLKVTFDVVVVVLLKLSTWWSQNST